VQWFDGQHLSKSPAQWDAAKLNWVNAHYLKTIDETRLAALVVGQLKRRGIDAPADAVQRACGLFKERCHTSAELADWLAMYFADVQPKPEDLAAHVTDAVRPALRTLRDKLATVDWNKAAIAAAIKETITAHGIKMPQLAHAVRVLVCGRAQTPSIDAVLELFPRETVLARLPGV
jgi:glutamyl-tRNA synthetase